MFKKAAFCAVALTAFAICAPAQRTSDLEQVADSLTTLIRERTTVRASVSIDKVTNRKGVKDIYFTGGLGDVAWDEASVKWLRDEIIAQVTPSFPEFKLGEIFCKGINVRQLIEPSIGTDGAFRSYMYRYADPRDKALPYIQQVGAQNFAKGLSGRYIALWQSHGRYYESENQRWEWQRAPVQRTVEDMYTQSYVIPFLIPMLENAGAYVLTPRERDIQTNEVVADNDPAFTEGRGPLVRIAGTYAETGSWSDAGEGFADAKAVYTGADNPFRMGTARQAAAVKGTVPTASAKWTVNVPESGSYALYISYRSLDNSSTNAHYTVCHRGGRTEYFVNQKMGGGTWMYLGTFEFDKDAESYVVLDNITPAGKKFVKKSVITADAVKIGGGMCKIARGPDSDPLETHVTSGMPAFAEGAMYWMQWAGVDTTITRHWEDDYANDYASRGAWVDMMRREKHIPFDLSLAFHTDAGTTMDDRIIGTLSVYTLLADGSRTLPDGKDRMTGRHLASAVQEQICRDVREDFEPEWTRRFLWDRSYSESRTPTVPAMLLELLSHQNFADMKYGLDPTFRFTVSRAIYKGMLKFLSDLYGVPYVVQPLAVNSFSATLGNAGNTVHLSWEPTVDTKEATADPTGYMVYTRVDDGPFDGGKIVRATSVDMPMDKGHIYSYKVVAFNDGGRSFPSEILAAGVPEDAHEHTVLVVNNFDRVSAPTWFDTPQYAGFDNGNDSGMPYINEINYIGEICQFRRDLPWMDDDNPGFGSTMSDYAGKTMAGNTFDYPYIHGKALMRLGYAFCSKSHAAFEASAQGGGILDLICGKQVTTKIGSGKVANRFRIFPDTMQKAIREFTEGGGSVIISGADIATDVWDKVYPIETDPEYRTSTIKFVQDVLGYKWLTGQGSYTARIEAMPNSGFQFNGLNKPMEYWNRINSTFYCVENPDGIRPVDNRGTIVLRYTHNAIPAAVFFDEGSYRVSSFGFPIETLKDPDDLVNLLRNTLRFVDGK